LVNIRSYSNSRWNDVNFCSENWCFSGCYRRMWCSTSLIIIKRKPMHRYLLYMLFRRFNSGTPCMGELKKLWVQPPFTSRAVILASSNLIRLRYYYSRGYLSEWSFYPLNFSSAHYPFGLDQIKYIWSLIQFISKSIFFCKVMLEVSQQNSSISKILKISTYIHLRVVFVFLFALKN